MSQAASRRQTLLSLMILLTLGVIGGGIFWAQYRFNPAVEALQEASVLIEAAKAPLQASDGEPLIAPPAGLTPLSPPEAFDRATLSDKINGKAELYLAAGVVGLKTQRFQADSPPESWLEAFVYDMGSFQNAYAVFSQQRRAEAETLKIAPYAYRTPNALFLVSGPFYVEMVGSAAEAQLMDRMTALAQAFVQKTGSADQAVAEADLFPRQGLQANSVTAIPTDAFGFERFNQVFTAAYPVNGTELTAFLSKRATPQEARELAEAYGRFLITFGGQNLKTALAVPDLQAVSILDTVEVFFAVGPYVAGVREATDQKAAEQLAARLHERLKEVAGGP